MSPDLPPKAKKSLGQHFLRDSGLCEKIVDKLEIRTGDQILEIGPGPGALTVFLRASAFGRLLLLEKDDEFAARQQNLVQAGVEVRHTDALTFPWAELSGQWKIIGNLPYNVASPLIWDFVAQVRNLERAVVMTQKEVADRIVAAPGSKIYGGLSVWVQSHAKVEKVFTLGPGAFSPPPKVDSSVIRLFPLPAGQKPGQPDALKKMIKILFSQRRKQLHHVLSRAYPETYNINILNSLNINPEGRPEQLPPMTFQQLALALQSGDNHGAAPKLTATGLDAP